MKIQLNTDKNIHGNEQLEASIAEKINHGLKQFSDKITRIEVHLSDENAHKSGEDDIQCKIEARIEGLQPVMVTAKDSSKEKSVDNAINKMKATLSSIIGKMMDR